MTDIPAGDAPAPQITQLARDVGDFFAPFFRVAFLSPLQEQSASADDVFAPESSATISDDDIQMPWLDSLRLGHYVHKLTIVSKGSSHNFFTITLTPPYEEALRFLDSGLVRYGAVVAVQWGYSSGSDSPNILSKVHTFRNAEPKASFSGMEITITVSGGDMFSEIASRQETRKVYERTIYATDLAIIDDVAKNYGWTVDTSKLSATSSLFTTKTEPSEQHESDFDFIRALCFDNNAWCRLVQTTLIIDDMDEVARRATSYNLLWRIQPSTKRDIPVLSIDINPDIRAFLPPEVRGLVTISGDLDSGELSAEIIDAAQDAAIKHIGEPDNTTLGTATADLGQTVKDPESGKQINIRPVQTERQHGSHISYPKNRNNAKEHVRQIVREAEYYANQRAVVTVPGFPDLAPTMLISLEGVGNSFSGIYMIRDVTHELSPDGYISRLEIFRNTSPTEEGARPISPPQPGTATAGGSTETPVGPDLGG